MTTVRANVRIDRGTRLLPLLIGERSSPRSCFPQQDSLQNGNVEEHPNRRAFRGVLTIVDARSDRRPAGARGHNVLMTKQAAEDSLHTLLGMGLCFTENFKGHDPRRKCGIITRAAIVENRIEVSGHIYERDFPEVVEAISACEEDFGMSFEVADAVVGDMRSVVWTLNRVTFVGASVLLKKKAAYKNTSITLA